MLERLKVRMHGLLFLLKIWQHNSLKYTSQNAIETIRASQSNHQNQHNSILTLQQYNIELHQQFQSLTIHDSRVLNYLKFTLAPQYPKSIMF